MNKTPVQELIEELQEEIRKQKQRPEYTPRGDVYNLALNKAIELATNKLEKEKQRIIEDYNFGQQIPPFDYAEKYYNQTYNSNQATFGYVSPQTQSNNPNK
jgi:hypothetical protein